MSRFDRLAASQLGSSALFGSAFFAVTLASDGLSAASTAGALAAASWFATLPLLKRVIEGIARA